MHKGLLNIGQVDEVVLADLKNTLNMIRKNIVCEDQATLLEQSYTIATPIEHLTA